MSTMSSKAPVQTVNQISGIAMMPTPLDLPLDRPRPAVALNQRARRSATVTPEIAETLERLAGESVTDSATVLLAVFLALLGRVSGQGDVIAGVAAGSGLFPVRVHLAGDPSFCDLLLQISDAALQDPVPVSTGLRVQAAFSARGGAVSATGLDLVLALQPSASGWTGFMDYDAEIFDPTTIVRFLAVLDRVLAAATGTPQKRLSELPWLSPSELHQLVVEWNDTAIVDTGSFCLNSFVEECARRQPDDIAWRQDAESLTWGEIDRLANRLAHRLRRLGVGPELLVGLFLQHSLPLIVAITGIHKAGGAYVPLDPNYPSERLAFMLADSGAQFLVSQPELLPQLPWSDLTPIILDSQWEILAEEPDNKPAVDVSPDNLAYVIYTSGSTGRPKGVAIRHRSAVVLMRWATQTFSREEAVGVLFSTSICFDVSVFELFLPAAHGTTGVFGRHPLALLDMPYPERVTLVSTAPSAVAELARLGPLPPSVQTFGLAGEALTARVAEALYRTSTVRRIWNLYGPTEDTTYSTFSLVPRDVPGPPAIGRPLAGGSVHLLDPDLRPVPLGSRGEIYLGGAGIARGYLGRPELTGERFVPDPFGTEPGARLYRTGDMGRYRPDGEIEYLGRTDQQVKIRGLRIEPGEIEAALTRCPGVIEAIVVVQQRHTSPQLVAFYVLEEGKSLPVAHLRRSLQNELPSYMVPERFVPLERLPLTPSGKVDRRQLATLPTAAVESEMVAPRNRLEFDLRQVWEDVLQVTPISVTDNFFALGGDSLLAITLMICIRDRFRRDMPPAVLLQAPTIEQLARLFSRELPRRGNLSLVPLHPGGGKPAFFCVHGAGGNVFQLVELARILGDIDPERPFWGLQAKSLMEDGEPLETIEEMADHYIDAIRSVQPEGPYHLGGYSMGGLVAYEMALRLLERGERMGLLAMLDAPPRPVARLPSFDLSRLVLMFAHELLVPFTSEDLAGLTPDEGLARVLEAGVRARRVPKEVTFQEARRYLRLMETTVEASRRYQLQRLYPGTLTVFAGQGLVEGLDGRWTDLPLNLETILVPGDHHSMFEQPYVEVLAGLLRGALDRAFPVQDRPAGDPEEHGHL